VRFIYLVLVAFLGLLPSAHGREGERETEVFRTGPGLTKPKLTSKSDPEYSPAARIAGVQGTVLLELVITEVGRPESLGIARPLGYGLDENAIECLSRWRFKPATKDGRPVKFLATVEIKFLLLQTALDKKVEERRIQFNSILTRLSKQTVAKPTDSDIKVMQDLAHEGLPGAEYEIGIWKIQGEAMTKDLAAGVASIQSAADKNYAPAIYFIGKSKMQGKLMPEDPTGGLALIRKAAILGCKEAQIALGQMFAMGDGVAVDLNAASRYLNLCAASGTAECQFQLGKLLLASPEASEEAKLQATAWFELAKKHEFVQAEEAAATEESKLTREQLRRVVQMQRELEPRH
jgi:TonB family protein